MHTSKVTDSSQMAEIVERALASLPAEELRYLNKANTDRIIDYIDWLLDNDYDEDARSTFPAVWPLLEKRIREYPHEARQVGERLPIQDALFVANKHDTAAPLSLVQLLIELHQEGLRAQDENGNVPLHLAVDHPCIDCFRAVLYNGNVEATTAQNNFGYTPFHWCTESSVGLARMWELLYCNRSCVNTRNYFGITALQLIAERGRQGTGQQQVTRQNAKIVLLKMAANYNHVPRVPNDEMIEIIESHPACTVVAPRLESGNDAFILHDALAAQCPVVIVQALVQIFPNQVQQQYMNGRLPLDVALQHGPGASIRLVASKCPAAMYIADPVTGLLPSEKAILNVGKDGSLENVDAVNALLQANPAFLEL